jgi:hypothetical protein
MSPWLRLRLDIGARRPFSILFIYSSTTYFQHSIALHIEAMESGLRRIGSLIRQTRSYGYSLHVQVTTMPFLSRSILNSKVGIHALYTLFQSSLPKTLRTLPTNLPVKVARISTSHTLLALRRRLLLLRWLIRLIRLVTTLRRCRRLLLWRRRSAMLRHLWLLWRVNARRALQRHLLHLRAQVWPLLLWLLLLLR